MSSLAQTAETEDSEARAGGRAVGIGCGIKNSGIGNGAREWGKARLVVERNGTISLYNGFTEMSQGLLTILIGIMLTDFPGKYKLERWLVRKRPVLTSINWLRQRAGKSPLATGSSSK